MKNKNWADYYTHHSYSTTNILLHFPYLIKIITENPRSILEIGCGPADHSMFIKSVRKDIKISLLDNEKRLLKRNKIQYGKKIFRTYPQDLLNVEETSKLPKFDLVISQGLMEHFKDKDLLKIVKSFSGITKKMIFSVPSDVYQNKDFGNEILRSKAQLEGLLKKQNSANFKVLNYFDIGIRTKLNLIKQNKMGIIDSVGLLLFKSCHLLVILNYQL